LINLYTVTRAPAGAQADKATLARAILAFAQNLAIYHQWRQPHTMINLYTVTRAPAGAQADKATLARAILTFAYYWYNFMPLARGTAACGYTVILSLFWAAGMPVTARIPKDVQVRCFAACARFFLLI